MQCDIDGIRGGRNRMLEDRLADIDIMGDVMYEAGTKVLRVWQSIVGVESGALRASGYVFLSIGGTKMDRVVADVITGEGTPRGGYGAAREFGIGIHPRSVVPPTPWMPQAPDNNLGLALELVDVLG